MANDFKLHAFSNNNASYQYPKIFDVEIYNPFKQVLNKIIYEVIVNRGNFYCKLKISVKNISKK